MLEKTKGLKNLRILAEKLKTQNLNRKALLSRSPTAILAFMWTITHLTPSVFHADQRDNRKFLIRPLGPEFWDHPHPHGEPQHQQGQ